MVAPVCFETLPADPLKHPLHFISHQLLISPAHPPICPSSISTVTSTFIASDAPSLHPSISPSPPSLPPTSAQGCQSFRDPSAVPMALKPVVFLLLWDLALFVHSVTSLCNVTCSTDYSTSLNCSCSGLVPTHNVFFHANCSGEYFDAVGSCEVKPPQSWCIMYPENLDDVASIGTTCTVTVSRQGDEETINVDESSSWDLSDVVKPLPPVDVQVTNTDGFYNITWDHNNQEDCLTYRVRIRDSTDLSKDPTYAPSVEKKQYLLDQMRLGLQPYVNYTVDVQAKMCPGNLYQGPWSEWSSTAGFKTTGPSEEIEGIDGRWWYLLFLFFPVLGLVLVVLSQIPNWQKRIQLIRYIPKPDDFFKPLYHNYEGNFKEWVKPVFSEYDYLRISSHIQMFSEKQHDVLQWANEKQSYSEDTETKQIGNFLHMLQPHSNSLLFFQDGGSSQGTGHSMGHISIHTVTLSGEEEFEEEVVSQGSVNTLRSYRHGESFGSFEEVNREDVGFDLAEHQLSRINRQRLPQREIQISNELSVENRNFQPHIQLNEPERVSLDSFASNEQSEDGYPRVDLDTLDSGFGECSSPGASDSNIAEQMDSDIFREHKGSNSNYVKQWMICSTIQEDSSNSENELNETQ
ncbi:hypothetical protein L3Q82_013504 [Scortum barcoo]|uniref:Uncharacterized protein n=1 Tax=Scortum barcoo TaxID=214431 RepID=A0ACB8W0T7_9TELE|nr:hypothetical protein L3Q82_013504 [Scortum barcoo]